MINDVNLNGVNGINRPQEVQQKADATASDVRYIGADETKEKSPIGAVGYPGASQVKPVTVLKAGEVYTGKAFDVACLGNNPIKLDLVTPENVGEYGKYMDIWCQKSSADVAAEMEENPGMKDPRFLHPKVGDSMQFYGLEPISSPYVNHDSEMVEYARANGLTAFNEAGEECYVNAYNGDREVIENTYTDADGNFLSEVGGLTGETVATQVKDTKTILLAPGSKVVPLESDNPKTVGIGDVVMCSVKKGKAKNDWFVKPATEFLKTAKKNAENAEFIDAVQSWVDNNGGREEWMQIVNRFGGQ